MMDPAADDLLTASIGRSPRNDPDPPGFSGFSGFALTKLTFMDYLLTMLRILLQRKQDHDNRCTPMQGFRTRLRFPRLSS